MNSNEDPVLILDDLANDLDPLSQEWGEMEARSLGDNPVVGFIGGTYLEFDHVTLFVPAKTANETLNGLEVGFNLHQ
ncbi:MAG: hypothetical protein H6624_03610 [Bdellovibrionaceae bacterium]|nr:hypothetical protein [Bdellovibrionales bacterium]MCB9083402.1 hypothetical protein [Pseudobdellovibrionaceae bacterium]